MINNNILANRLNQTRQGLKPPNEKSEEFSEPLNSSDTLKETNLDLTQFSAKKRALVLITSAVIELGKFAGMSLIFGLATNILLDVQFTLPESGIVGLALGIVAIGFYSIFKRN